MLAARRLLIALLLVLATATTVPAQSPGPTAVITPGAGASVVTEGLGVVGNLMTTNGGLAVQAKQGVASFTTTSATTVLTLPAGAVPLNISVDVTSTFNDSGTDLLDVGITGTGNYFINDLDIAATGRKAPTLGNLGVSVGSSPVNVQATYIPQNANPSSGTAVITVTYIVR